MDRMAVPQEGLAQTARIDLTSNNICISRLYCQPCIQRSFYNRCGTIARHCFSHSVRTGVINIHFININSIKILYKMPGVAATNAPKRQHHSQLLVPCQMKCIVLYRSVYMAFQLLLIESKCSVIKAVCECILWELAWLKDAEQDREKIDAKLTSLRS